MQDRARTAAQELAQLKMMMELDRQKKDWSDVLLRDALIPKEWAALERTTPVRPRRKKVTIALDEDVARWFHRLGEGYHRRMNGVLRTYMLAVMSKTVLQEGDWNRHWEEIWGKAAPKRKEEE